MFKKVVNRSGRAASIPEISLDEFLSKCLADCAGSYVYRGQADARWDIVPSGFRSEAGALASVSERNSRIRKFQDSPFQSRCQELREMLVDRENIKDLKDSEYRELQLMVIAQHFGVPTPLIDWTRSPLIAAYMATSFKKTPSVIGLFRLDRSTHPDDVIYTDYSEVSFSRMQSQLGGVTCFGSMGTGTFHLTCDTFTEYFEHRKSDIKKGVMDCFISRVNVRIETEDYDRLTRVLAANGITTENLFPQSGYWKAAAIREDIIS